MKKNTKSGDHSLPGGRPVPRTGANSDDDHCQDKRPASRPILIWLARVIARELRREAAQGR